MGRQRADGVDGKVEGNVARTRVAHITTVDMSLRYLLLNQLRFLQEAGYDVTGVSAPGPDVAAISRAGIRHIPVPMTRTFSPLVDLRTLVHLYKVIRRERFTIVHTHNPKPGLLGQMAARLARTPVVVNTLHGFYFHDNMPAGRRRFYIATERVAASCSDGILSQNREDIAQAVKLGICPPGKIAYLGNGIDLERFDVARVEPERVKEARRDLGLPASAPVVGFVGRLVAEKGVRELLEAARIVLRQAPGVRFLFVGPADAEKADALTPGVAANYGEEVAEACVFAGLRHDMPEMYALMRVFVLPSHREGFPRAPMEATAMAVPCVLTDIRGCREVVEHGRNGLLVRLGDVDALAEAILALLSDRERAERMGAQGREMARRRFDERAVFEKVRREYERLLRRKGLPIPVPGPTLQRREE